MEKINPETPDLTQDNIGKIAKLFPDVVTEMQDADGNVVRAIDFDALKGDLSGGVAEGKKERYQFTWPGKAAAKLEARTPCDKTMRPCPEESVNWDTTQNLYIEGDNLEALKIMRETYAGKVKLIYIDPPYNTGHDFIYDDDFSKSRDDYEETSDEFDEEGGRLVANPESNGRFHSDWCSMMYPRLLLAKDLLDTNGLIAISIDDNELSNLRKICDEIFGQTNFVDTIVWKKRYGGGPKEKYLVTLQDYILIYAKSLASIDDITVPLSDESIARYYTKKDSNYARRGPYRTHPLEANKTLDARPNLVFGIPTPDGGEVWPKRQWLWGQSRVNSAIANDEIEFSKSADGNWSVQTKQYLRLEDGSIRRGKLMSIIEDIYTQHGTNEMIDLFGEAKAFPYPKPTALLKQIFGIIPDRDALFLDFFSGSASSVDAIMQLNAEDDGTRHIITVQIPELCSAESEARKLGFNSLCDIGKERIRRAGAKTSKGVEESNKQLQLGKDPKPIPDIGFRVLQIDSSNYQNTYGEPESFVQDSLDILIDNLKIDRTSEDLLFQVMPKFRIPYSATIDKIDLCGKEVFDVNSGQLLACFDVNVGVDTIEAIAKRKPVYAVLRDASLVDDSTAANFEELFKTFSPDTIRRVI